MEIFFDEISHFLTNLEVYGILIGEYSDHMTK